MTPQAEFVSTAGLPDPGESRTVDEVIARLRLLKVWAGDPSYDLITARINEIWTAAGRPVSELARRATVADCFKPGRRRLNPDLVVTLVQVLHRDEGYVAQWRQALHVVAGQTHAAAQVRAYDTLPQDLVGFTGRSTELDKLRGLLQPGATLVICAIEGMAGVGKTQLAVHAGHLLAAEQPFAPVLFANLRGFGPDPAQPPADPAAVLDNFLRLLGVPGQQIPHDLQARTALYQKRLAATHALVVLDNAADEAQVRPLLPDGPRCLTLVTSRRHLAGLPSAVHLTVDVFTPAEAMDFLTHAVPEVPVGSDPHAPARIALRCGYLPLALSLVAGHIRGTHGWTLTDHADRLDERHRRRHLDTGIELALDLSYQRISADQQRLLRLAALHPGQHFDAHAAAALTDTDPLAAQAFLRDLCRDHLLQQASPGRYNFHDLVQAHAAGIAIDQDPPPQRHAALNRLFDYYTATAATAMSLAYPHERQRRPTVVIVPIGTPTPHLTDRADAERWLDTELSNLLAVAHYAQHDRPEHTWQLSVILDPHLRTRGRYQDAQTLHERALRLARQLRHHPAELSALNDLGLIHRTLGHHEKASELYKQALQVAQRIGYRSGELDALHGLGYVHWLQGRYEPAADRFGQALQIAEEIGDRGGERRALGGLGSVNWLLGRYELAAGQFGQALQIAEEIGDRSGELAALHGLGLIHRMLGRHHEANGCYQQALRIAQDIGDRVGELYALAGLGDVHLMRGRHSEANNCYQQVLELARRLGNNWQFEALQGLGRVHHATGHPDLALTHHQEALQLATDLTQALDQARAHDGLAHAHHALDDHQKARWHWQQALDVLTSLGVDHTDDREANVPNIRAHLNNLDQAQGDGARPRGVAVQPWA